MKVKVISLPYIFQVLYVLCFTRPRYQVSVHRTIGPLVQIITLSVAMESSGRISPNFELIQAFMHVLIACKYEKDQMQNSGENVMTSFSPLKVYGIFFRRSRAANSVVHGRISPNFELIQALMYIIITCKYEMNPIKNVRENVMTPFFPL